jgi:hypothetical protein|tara:strand:+ start:20119 stop:21132 length:1014 start_codon:yes stop_codon:yes gene_type:complete
MAIFYENDPSDVNYWRSIILYGKNVASYKFALAKSIIEIKSKNKEFISLEELSGPFSSNICEHLRNYEKQITRKSDGIFLENCKKFNQGEINKDKLIEVTKKEAFKIVIDAFHEVNGRTIPNKFFIDERKTKKGIQLTDNFFKLYELEESENLYDEVESRWNLVETAWKLNLSPNFLDYDKSSGLLIQNKNRIGVTSAKNALNGYQKSKCFFCFDYISIISKSKKTCDVDHFFPNTLKSKNFIGYIDGIWNYVLACKNCNRGVNGKFAQLPSKKLLSRLHKRNEYYCGSHHPLRETIMAQTGKTEIERIGFLQKCFNDAKEKLIHVWEPEAVGDSIF